MPSDLELAFHLIDEADAETARRWRTGASAWMKDDGTPVTAADIAAEEAMLSALRRACPEDGFLGEELGEHSSHNGRRWIADGIDGTRFYAAGSETWGTLLALEIDDTIVLGVSSKPVRNRRWWAELGAGAFAGRCDGSNATPLRVSARAVTNPERVVCLPELEALSPVHQQIFERLAGGRPVDRPRSHQNRVAQGEVDLCVRYAGGIWNHAAPSIIVEEPGGRCTDHKGGRRLDSRTAVYSNGINHDQVLSILGEGADEP